MDASLEYQKMNRHSNIKRRASLEWMPVTSYKPAEMASKMPHPSIDHRDETKTTMMASKDDNKRKYVADGAEEEVEEAPLKK
jgi:hypothetical protein